MCCIYLPFSFNLERLQLNWCLIVLAKELWKLSLPCTVRLWYSNNYWSMGNTVVDMGIEIVNKMHTCSVNCVIRHWKGVPSFWEKPQYNSNCTSKLRTFVLLTKFFPFSGNTEEWFSPRWGSHASFISKPGWQVKRRRDFIIVFIF